MSDSLQGGNKMSPSYQHSYVQSNLNAALHRFHDYTVFSELSLQINDKDVVPDLCVYQKRFVNFTETDVIRMTDMPIAAIEILSPSQTVFEAQQKILTYFQAGVKSCWLVVPPTQTVTVYHAPNQGQLHKTGDVVDSVINVRIPLDEIFA